MPIIKSTYKAPFIYRNGHIATILPSLFRKIKVAYTRERINTPDGDFLDIDSLKNNNKAVVIISHGLEGNSHRHYVTGTANLFAQHNWDVVAWNCRSCSGEMNLKPRLYSHVDAPDLSCVIDYVLASGKYEDIGLVGFSMGGAITLNYLTKMINRHPLQLKSAVVISAPVDVGGSANELEKGKNRFYRQRFLKKMGHRMKEKALQFPGMFNTDGIDKITTFKEYDIKYTAPLHDCKSPAEFYEKASTSNKLAEIDVPTLLLIAQDDPFMPASCYPYDEAETNPYLYLEAPKYGGHVGFIQDSLRNSWMEKRAYEFMNQTL